MSLATRIICAMIAVVVIAAGCTILIFDWHAHSTAAELERMLVSRQAARARAELAAVAEQMRGDLEVVARLSPLESMLVSYSIGPLDTASSENAASTRASSEIAVSTRESSATESRGESERVALGLMQSRPAYLQLRVIDHGGMERLRVDRDAANGPARVLGAAELQYKGDRGYFAESSRLARHEFYFSRIDLNREHGRVDIPYRPVWRAATPVFTTSGRRLGIIIINLDARPILASIQRHASYLLDESGHFLAHPEDGRAFEFEVDPEAPTLSDEFPQLARRLGEFRAERLPHDGIILETDRGGAHFVSAMASLLVANGPTLVVLARQESIRSPLLERARVTSLLGSFVIALVAIGWGVMLARSISGPLENLTHALTHFPNIDRAAWPATRIPEISTLVQTLRRASQMVFETRRVAEREAEFRLIVDASPVALLLVDESLRVRLANRSALTLLGFEPGELMHESIDRLLPPEIQSTHASLARTYLGSREIRAMAAGRALSAVRKDGSLVPVEIGLSPVTVGGEAMVLTALVDLTEQVRARRWVESLLSGLPTAKLLVASDGRITMANEAAAELFGYPKDDELLGRLAEDLFETPDSAGDPSELVGPPARQSDSSSSVSSPTRSAAEVRAKLQQRIAAAKGELRARRRRGPGVPVELRLSIVEGPTAQFVLASAVDISDQQSIKAALRRSNSELARFASAASHDLKEPLRGIAGFAQLLKDKYGDQLDERALRYLSHILVNSERMLRLITDVLAFARLDADLRPFEPVDCKAVLDEVIASLRIPMAETNTHIEVDTLPSVLGDATQLGRVFQNLISNAIKFRGDRPPRVVVRARRTGEDWEFSVADNGIGISAKHHRQIFEMFQRVHTQREYTGSGIGLAMAQRIVRRHGGRIWVESTAGEGATFYFTVCVANDGTVRNDNAPDPSPAD